jgi:hypothetical protein
MDRPLSHSLSFDDLEVLVLVEHGGATPREVEETLGMDRRESQAIFRDLVGRGWLDWQGRAHSPGSMPLPWNVASTIFQLTPMARLLRQDEAFTSTAFAASLLPATQNREG